MPADDTRHSAPSNDSTPPDYSVDGVTFLADAIEGFRKRFVCAYGASEHQTCDCKYRPTWIDAALGDRAEQWRATSEQTGCCELRAAVAVLREKVK